MHKVINTVELEVTRRLFPEYKTDRESWGQAMDRLKGIHQDNSVHPLRCMVRVKTFREALGLATYEAEVSNNALRNYGVDLRFTLGSISARLP